MVRDTRPGVGLFAGGTPQPRTVFVEEEDSAVPPSPTQKLSGQSTVLAGSREDVAARLRARAQQAEEVMSSRDVRGSRANELRRQAGGMAVADSILSGEGSLTRAEVSAVLRAYSGRAVPGSEINMAYAGYTGDVAGRARAEAVLTARQERQEGIRLAAERAGVSPQEFVRAEAARAPVRERERQELLRDQFLLSGRSVMASEDQVRAAAVREVRAGRASFVDPVTGRDLGLAGGVLFGVRPAPPRGPRPESVPAAAKDFGFGSGTPPPGMGPTDAGLWNIMDSTVTYERRRSWVRPETGDPALLPLVTEVAPPRQGVGLFREFGRSASRTASAFWGLPFSRGSVTPDFSSYPAGSGLEFAQRAGQGVGWLAASTGPVGSLGVAYGVGGAFIARAGSFGGAAVRTAAFGVPAAFVAGTTVELVGRAGRAAVVAREGFSDADLRRATTAGIDAGGYPFVTPLLQGVVNPRRFEAGARDFLITDRGFSPSDASRAAGVARREFLPVRGSSDAASLLVGGASAEIGGRFMFMLNRARQLAPMTRAMTVLRGADIVGRAGITEGASELLMQDVLREEVGRRTPLRVAFGAAAGYMTAFTLGGATVFAATGFSRSLRRQVSTVGNIIDPSEPVTDFLTDVGAREFSRATGSPEFVPGLSRVRASGGDPRFVFTVQSASPSRTTPIFGFSAASRPGRSSARPRTTARTTAVSRPLRDVGVRVFSSPRELRGLVPVGVPTRVPARVPTTILPARVPTRVPVRVPVMVPARVPTRVPITPQVPARVPVTPRVPVNIGVPVTTIVPYPRLPFFPLGGGRARTQPRGGGGWRAPRIYTPSLRALTLNIQTSRAPRAPGGFTGFEMRPIVIPQRRRR